MYLHTTSNIGKSSPVNIVVNSDGTINIHLLTYNTYGYQNNSYSLIFCNYNVQTYAFIEKITNSLGSFLVNMVCFDSNENRTLPKNNLNFVIEISKFPNGVGNADFETKSK